MVTQEGIQPASEQQPKMVTCSLGGTTGLVRTNKVSGASSNFRVEWGGARCYGRRSGLGFLYEVVRSGVPADTSCLHSASTVSRLQKKMWQGTLLPVIWQCSLHPQSSLLHLSSDIWLQYGARSLVDVISILLPSQNSEVPSDGLTLPLVPLLNPGPSLAPSNS